MNYFLTEEQELIRDLARRIAREKVKPVAAELDENEEFPHEIVQALAASDLFAVAIPEQYGGLGGGVLELCLVVEELSRACAGVAVTYAASFLGSLPLVLGGSHEQKARFLHDLASGQKLAAFGLTEADAGSDAASIRTTAVRDGDHYVLNGTKQWITNGGEADVYTIIALTDKRRGPRGASAFVVEKGTPGFSFGKKEKKMGIRCSATRELVFEDCRIPRENLLGKEGTGFVLALKTLDRARPGVGAQSVGLAQGALDVALAYSRQRRQFGQAISSFQAIQHKLADMATQIEAARALVYATARTIDSGAKDFARESAMSKLFASDVAMRVTVEAVQVLGGYGYMRDYPAEKYMRDAKITQIYEGTNEIQRNVIALSLVREAASRD
ncbi:MAG: acyl-CoA dehydrogenase family protein [Bacillota bacterium]